MVRELGVELGVDPLEPVVLSEPKRPCVMPELPPDVPNVPSPAPPCEPESPCVKVLCDSAERSEPVPDELPLIPVAPNLPDCAAVLPPSACRRLGFRISTWQPQLASEHR